jgi:hypothetical protein
MTSRERFEAWAIRSITLPILPLARYDCRNGGYKDQLTQVAWQAWQAGGRRYKTDTEAKS